MVRYFIHIILLVLISFNGNAQTLKRYTLNPLGFSNNTIASMGEVSIKIDSNSTTLVGYPIPPKLFLDTTVFIQEGLFCAGDSIKLYIKKSPYNKWYENGTLIAENKDTIITKKSATYFAVMEDGFGYTDSTRKIITKFDTYPDVTLNLAGDSVFCDGKQAVIRSNRTNGSNLVWLMDGQPINNASDSLLIKKPGTYFAYASSPNNCKTFSKTKYKIVVNPLPQAPTVRDTAYCQNQIVDTLKYNVNIGNTFLWYNSTTSASSNIAPKPSTSSVGTFNYYLSQLINATGCEGAKSKITITVKSLPSTPVISRDSANFLVSLVNPSIWYKEGTLLSDSSLKLKPINAGMYTLKTFQNGCFSLSSEPYYFIATDVINLSATEFIKLAPNPFQTKLNFDFVIKGYQKLNMDVFELATGRKVSSRVGLTPGSPVYLPELVGGTYIVRITSADGKLSYQFKMMKM